MTNWILTFLLAGAPAWAGGVAGTVRNTAGRPLAGARIERVGGPEAAVTDERGVFRLDLPDGALTLRVTAVGHVELLRDVQLDGLLSDLTLALEPAPRLDETVVVEAVRAADWMPVTAQDVTKGDLERLDHGQEMPFLLKETPSLTQTSDNGSEGGYSYLYLRGIPQTRLNLTLDGVPLTDAEDGAFYWVNAPGLAGALDSVQVQRGVGTSSFGAASFGGALSLASVSPGEKLALDVRASLGSLGTGRAALALHSGRFGPGLAAFSRATYQQTDGYRDHSAALQRGLFFGASRQGERSFLKITGLAGREQQQLSFYAVDEGTLATAPRENPLSPAERDRFSQQLWSAQLSYSVSSRTRLTAQAYTTAAGGWYRLYADPERTSLYEYGLEWRTLGGMASVNHTHGPFTLTAGGHVLGFSSTHTRDVVEGGRDYLNRGDKEEQSAFAKAGFEGRRVSVWADTQVRHARFAFTGDLDLGSVSWTFFNPRVGLRYELAAPFSAYLSLGQSRREPARSDLFAGEDNPTLRYDLREVRPERVTNLEAGVDLKTDRFSAQANLYLMEFRDEIAQTGELSEIGLPLRRNVDRSYRRGVELQATYRPDESWRLAAALNLNRSRIRTWTQFLDVYDAAGSYGSTEARTFPDTPPLLTPSVVGNLNAAYQKGAFRLSAMGRYVGRAHLDNTGASSSRTPGFFDADLGARLDLGRWLGKASGALRLDVTNVFDHRRRWPGGYSYLFLTRDAAGSDTPGGVSYFYPLAGRTVYVGLEFGL